MKYFADDLKAHCSIWIQQDSFLKSLSSKLVKMGSHSYRWEW